jgi:hypothetical protein
MDGGIANHAPLSDALELGAERIYVLSTGIACDLTEPPHGALGMLLHSMSLLLMRRLQVEVELLADRAELIVLPPPCPPGSSPIDFSRSDELIGRALEESTTFLDQLELGRIENPASGLAHPAPVSVSSKHELHRQRLASLPGPASGLARSRRTASMNGYCVEHPAPRRPPQASTASWRRSGSCDPNHDDPE